jgi:hypothetical protein
MKSPKMSAMRWTAAFVLLLGVALLLAFLSPSSLTPAQAYDAEDGGQVLVTTDYSQMPPQVLADARTLAASLYPHDATKAADLTSQLVGTYLAAEDEDFVVIFNPGGWGWDPMSNIPGWESIMLGIKNTLGGFGYKTLLIDYERTPHGFDGIIGETEVLLGIQPAKAQELAARITFLTQHLPNLRVIITGESNGASIADEAVRLLADNPRVFAIETGPPLWHPCLEFARSLVIKNNGVQPDAFSNGNIILILRSNAESAFGIYHGAQGNILLYIGAPGHYYSWDYETVRAKITDFLTANFPQASG